jgi:septum formation protein
MIGLPYTVFPPRVDEEAVSTAMPPDTYVAHLAQEKGRSVKTLKNEPAVILAADTIVWIDGRIIGKPHSNEEAADILKTLQGRNHTVWSGMYVSNTDTGIENTATVQTTVHMKQMTDSDISWYTQAEHLLDKAGAYAIQGKGACFIDRIEGEYYNVVGLPVAALKDLLASVEYDIIRTV